MRAPPRVLDGDVPGWHKAPLERLIPVRSCPRAWDKDCVKSPNPGSTTAKRTGQVDPRSQLVPPLPRHISASGSDGETETPPTPLR